ncbi:MAG: glycosyltransferase [Chlamydiales bacterium]
MKTHRAKKNWADEVAEYFTPKPQTEAVSLSLIIPTYNCSHKLTRSLESVKRQNYSPLEVIVIDASSTDKTLNIVSLYGSLITRVYIVAAFNVPEMLNRGVSLASSQFISFLYPGSFYISDETYSIFAEAVIDNAYPDMVYCGCIQREIKAETFICKYDFDDKTLKAGHHITSMSACWMQRDFFLRIGKLNSSYDVRFAFDIFCRFYKLPKRRVKQLDRVLIDFDYGTLTATRGLRKVTETWKILKDQFGLKVALKWFLTIKYTLLIQWLWHALKRRVFGKE